MIGKSDILYEDSEIIVCRKESGIAIQTGKTGCKDMVSLLRNYFAQKKENTEIFIVHRLDQPVEGVMVFARTNKAAAKLSRQIQERSFDKYYLAVAEGKFESRCGILEDYLLRNGKTNLSGVVSKESKGGKYSKLSYEVLETRETVSLVKIKLDTGRHHQIRVQMAQAGHPLVGDKKYNPDCKAGFLPIGLCSVKLSFSHPMTEETNSFYVKPKGIAFEKFNCPDEF